MQMRKCTCHLTPSTLASSCTHFWWLHIPYIRAYYLHAPSYEKENKREICILLTQLKELQRKRATYRFPPWNQFHLCRNCSQGNEKSSFSYSFAYIVGLFSILLITKYCINLNALNQLRTYFIGNLHRIHSISLRIQFQIHF